MVREFSEVSLHDSQHTVLLDQWGSIPLEEFSHPEKCAYIFGRTSHGSLIDKIPHDCSVRIDTPYPIKGIFGVSICAILLYDRVVKHGSHY
jgi:hypothetical protein